MSSNFGMATATTGTGACEAQEKPLINIHFTAGQLCVWHAEEVATLRREHHIVGSLIGALPGAPRQNAQLGLPLQLMPEEAAILLHHGVGRLVTMSMAKPSPDQVKEFKQTREESIREQKALWQKHQAERKEQLREVIEEGKKRKKERGMKKEAKNSQTEEKGEKEDCMRNVCTEKQADKDVCPAANESGHDLGNAVEGRDELRSSDLLSPSEAVERGGRGGECSEGFRRNCIDDEPSQNEGTTRTEVAPLRKEDPEQPQPVSHASAHHHHHLQGEEDENGEERASGMCRVETCRDPSSMEPDARPSTSQCDAAPRVVGEVVLDQSLRDASVEVRSTEADKVRLEPLCGHSPPACEREKEAALPSAPPPLPQESDPLNKMEEDDGCGSHHNEAVLGGLHDAGDEKRRTLSEKDNENVDGKTSASCGEKEDIFVKDSGCSVQLFTAEPLNSEMILEASPRAWRYPSSEREELRYRVFLHFWEMGYFLTSGTKFGGDFLVYPGDPFVFHSYFIVVCIPFHKQLTALDLVSHGRLGTFVKKTVVLCSLGDDQRVVTTSLQWSGIS